MIPLYSEQDFENSKAINLLPLKCKFCGKTFFRQKRRIQSTFTQSNYNGDYCSIKCCSNDLKPPTIVHCKQCNKPVKKNPSDIKRVKNVFCSSSCSAKYHNQNKKTGTRVSKMEISLQTILQSLYPNTNFHFNRTDKIKYELDIYIPLINVAFEINGLLHYKPIYGQEKLNKIQSNDSIKKKLCAENGIQLFSIDISSMKRFNEKDFLKYLHEICFIINSKL